MNERGLFRGYAASLVHREHDADAENLIFRADGVASAGFMDGFFNAPDAEAMVALVRFGGNQAAFESGQVADIAVFGGAHEIDRRAVDDAGRSVFMIISPY